MLTHKNKKWAWGSSEQSAFKSLKRAVTSTPILTFPSDTGHFHLECDASNYTTGAVLSQQQMDEEHNYPIHDKELLLIMHVLEEWRHFLKGAAQPFEVFTDHHNLLYFHTAQKLNRRQA